MGKRRSVSPIRTLEDNQAEVSDIMRHAKGLIYALGAAESCETERDYHTNMTEAFEAATEALAGIREIATCEICRRVIHSTTCPAGCGIV